jgi:hypothetical protein
VGVRKAFERELVALPADLRDSALAATALVLAAELDKPKNSATSKSMCARVLADVLEQLRELMPPVEEGDSLDDLAARRRARRAVGGSGA